MNNRGIIGTQTRRFWHNRTITLIKKKKRYVCARHCTLQFTCIISSDTFLVWVLVHSPSARSFPCLYHSVGHLILPWSQVAHTHPWTLSFQKTGPTWRILCLLMDIMAKDYFSFWCPGTLTPSSVPQTYTWTLTFFTASGIFQLPPEGAMYRQARPRSPPFWTFSKSFWFQIFHGLENTRH